MGAQEAPDAALRDLMQAAEKRNWMGCRDTTGKLLALLPPHQAFELARQYLESRLPLFERHQPYVSWPRAFLEALRAAEPSAPSVLRWPADNDEFPGPGANSFISGVNELWEARQLPLEAPQRVERVLAAISNGIMAELVESWGARHPEDWARWLWVGPEGETHPDAGRIQDRMMRAPETARVERAAWLEVAERLHEALGSR